MSQPVARRGRVLVVDDEPVICTLFAMVIARHGHTVVTAATLAAARAACRERAPDVVIVDMFMPDGSGVGLIVTLRQAYARSRLIAITGGTTWDGCEVLVQAKDAGADIALRRPVPTAVLADAVEELLGLGPP